MALELVRASLDLAAAGISDAIEVANAMLEHFEQRGARAGAGAGGRAGGRAGVLATSGWAGGRAGGWPGSERAGGWEGEWTGRQGWRVKAGLRHREGLGRAHLRAIHARDLGALPPPHRGGARPTKLPKPPSIRGVTRARGPQLSSRAALCCALRVAHAPQACSWTCPPAPSCWCWRCGATWATSRRRTGSGRSCEPAGGERGEGPGETSYLFIFFDHFFLFND